MAGSRKSRPSDLPERLRAALGRHVAPGARLTLALSGGVDSIAALDLLAALAPAYPYALDCLHVNHGISPNAAAWARFARAAARRYGLACAVKRVDLAPYRARGLEGAARAARYAAFARVRSDFVVLAQHQDDQAETVLLQLVRGAGVAGLAAMPVVRNHADRGAPKLLRPLAGASRAEIEAYARARGLAWVEDETNRDEARARNFVRQRVMPLLRELNPQAAAALARSAAHLAEANALLQALAELDATESARNGRFSVAALAGLARPRAKNALRWHLAAAGVDPPSSAQLEELLDQVLGARDDARVHIALAGGDVRRYRGEVWVVAKRAAPARDFRARWAGEPRWRLPELGGMLRFTPARGEGLSRRALIDGPVEVRARRGGERLQPDAKRPRRALKHLLQEAQIPPWERAGLPLLFCGRRLAFVPGIGLDAGLRAKPGEAGLVVTWQPLVEGRALRRQTTAKPMLK